VILVHTLTDEEMVELNKLIADNLGEDLFLCQGPDGEPDISTYSDSFPPWAWLQHRDRCRQLLPELVLMAADEFEHFLTPLHEYVLYRMMGAWRDVAVDYAGDAENDEDRKRLADRAARLEYYLDEVFEDHDFNMGPMIAKAALDAPHVLVEMDINPEAFLELMPDDIRAEVEWTLAEAKLAVKAPAVDQPAGDAPA
jgi:hypothetical protein